MSKKVFVSGGAGVIGRELVPKLIARGYKVLVGDLVSRPPEFNDDIEYWQGDLNEMTLRELELFGPNFFIHLAASFERSEETYDFWDENFRNNVLLSHHLTSLVKELSSLRRIVFASSYLIYDKSNYQFESSRNIAERLSEDHPVNPRNLTGMAKLSHEIELAFLLNHKSESFNSVCARIYRGYGKNSRDVISRWIRDLLQERAIRVFRPEGIFDYMFARDSAEGLIRLMEKIDVEGVINLGTGRPRRVSDVLNILKLYFPDMKVEEIPSDIPFEASSADERKLLKALDWLPEFDLEQTIPEIINFERERLDKPSKITRSINILITSASNKVPLVQSVKNAARKFEETIQVLVGDISSQVTSKYFGDAFWQMPATIDQNLEQICQGCVERDISIIIPTRDGELDFWSRNKKLFLEKGINVLVSDNEVILRCLDKLRFHEHCQELNIPSIRTADNMDSFKLNNECFVVKERFGSGAQNMCINITEKDAIEFAKDLNNPIFQPFIAGREVSCDAYFDRDGFFKGLVLRERSLVIHGESHITKTFRNKELEKSIEQDLVKFKFMGPVVAQLFVHQDNTYEFIEINARFGGASSTSIGVGLDIFRWILLEELDEEKAHIRFMRSEEEVCLVRSKSDQLYYDNSL